MNSNTTFSMDLESKTRNILHDINQYAKHMFSSYSIMSDIAFNPNTIHDSHVIYLPNKLHWEFPIENMTYKLYSDAINLAFREKKKKELLSIELRSNDIVLISDDKNYIIGNVISDAQKISYVYNKYINIIHMIQDCEYIDISEELFKELKSNGFIRVIFKDLRIRLSSRILPNLKKDDSVRIYFKDIDSDMFQSIFQVTKETGMITYHIYNFTKY